MSIDLHPAQPNAPVDHSVLEEWDAKHPDHVGDAEYRHLLIEITNDSTEETGR
jgi:hypothetical protein